MSSIDPKYIREARQRLERAQAEEQEIADGMVQWEPGSLSTIAIERILMDALADLWADCYRGGPQYAGPSFQRNLFREKLMHLVRSATGQEMRVT